MTATGAIRIVESRQAAVARLVYATERPGGVAVLCGPAGTGKTVVLHQLAAALEPHGRVASVRRPAEWASEAAATCPDVMLVDDAHLADTATLVALLDRCRHAGSSVVLAGQGRLLTLVSRDTRLENAVTLRATLQPFTMAETRLVLDGGLFTGVFGLDAECRAAVAATIHEIAAGVPAVVERLAALAAVVATGRPRHGLAAADIEAIHRRLSIRAA